MKLLQRHLVARQVRKLRGAGELSPGALEALEKSIAGNGPQAIPPLIDALADPTSRPPALRVLALLVSDEQLPRFLDAMGSRNPLVSASLSKLLSQSKSFDPVPLLDLIDDPSLRQGLDPVLTAQAHRLPLSAVIDRLPDVGREARLILLRVLDQLVNETAIPRLVTLLGHGDWWVRLSVCRLLARFDTDAARAGLIRATGDARPEVRREVLKALRNLNARDLVKDMIPLLGDPDLTVQTEAIDTISALGDDTAVPHLLEALKSESEYARRSVVEVLNQTASPKAIQDLVRALRDADWWVRVRAADALGGIGGEPVVRAVTGLLEDEDDFMRRYAVEILNTVTSSEAVLPLITVLDDADWWVRERAIDALGKTKDPRAVEPLLRLLGDEVKVSRLAAKALGSIGDERAVEPLIRLAASGGDAATEAREALRGFRPAKLSEANRERMAKLLEHMPSPTRPVSILARRRDPETGRVSRPADREPLVRTPGEPKGDVSAAKTPGESWAVRFHQLPEGYVLLDRYVIRKRVGRGGFGAIYLVEDQVVLDELILKILNPQLSADEVAVKRFAQELKLARRISHPNVIRLYDLIDLGGIHAVSMEYFPGRDLSKRLRDEGPLDQVRALGIVIQVCAGLAAAHAEGVIHRDIKPGNILVGLEGGVKIVDFGLASAAQHKDTRLTESGLLIGTPEYMTPEQIRGGNIDHRADIYALGIILYEMLSGRQPYRGDTPVNTLFRHLEGGATPLTEFQEGIDPELSDIIAKAMAVDPMDRIAGAEELRARLESILHRITPERKGDAENRRVS